MTRLHRFKRAHCTRAIGDKVIRISDLGFSTIDILRLQAFEASDVDERHEREQLVRGVLVFVPTARQPDAYAVRNTPGQ